MSFPSITSLTSSLVPRPMQLKPPTKEQQDKGGRPIGSQPVQSGCFEANGKVVWRMNGDVLEFSVQQPAKKASKGLLNAVNAMASITGTLVSHPIITAATALFGGELLKQFTAGRNLPGEAMQHMTEAVVNSAGKHAFKAGLEAAKSPATWTLAGLTAILRNPEAARRRAVTLATRVAALFAPLLAARAHRTR